MNLRLSKVSAILWYSFDIKFFGILSTLKLLVSTFYVFPDSFTVYLLKKSLEAKIERHHFFKEGLHYSVTMTWINKYLLMYATFGAIWFKFFLAASVLHASFLHVGVSVRAFKLALVAEVYARKAHKRHTQLFHMLRQSMVSSKWQL